MTHAANAGAFREARAYYLTFGVLQDALANAEFDPQLAAEAHTEVEVVEDERLRRRLQRALWNANPHGQSWPRCVANDILVLGIRLHNGARYDGAIDFLGLVADSRYVDMDTRLRAMSRRAMTARTASKLPYAEMAYTVMRDVARSAGNGHMELMAEIGLANVAIHRGRFNDAEQQLGRTLLASQRAGDAEMAARASACIGTLAGLRGDHRAAYLWSVAAIPALRNKTARHRAQQNAAEALAHLGRHEEAREMASWLADRAPETAVRIEADDTLYRVQAAESRSDDRPQPVSSSARFEPLGPSDAERLAEFARMVIG